MPTTIWNAHKKREIEGIKTSLLGWNNSPEILEEVVGKLNDASTIDGVKLGKRLQLEIPRKGKLSEKTIDKWLKNAPEFLNQFAKIVREQTKEEEIKTRLLEWNNSPEILKEIVAKLNGKLEEKLQLKIPSELKLTKEKIAEWLREVPSKHLDQFEEIVRRESVFKAEGLSEPYSESLNEMLKSGSGKMPETILHDFRMKANEKIASFVNGLSENPHKKMVFYKILKENDLIKESRIKPENIGDLDKILKIIELMEKREDGDFYYMSNMYKFYKSNLQMSYILSTWKGVPGGK